MSLNNPLNKVISKMNTEIKKDTKLFIKYPDKFKVILFNDQFTSFEFVEKILIKIYNKNIEEAKIVTKNIHKDGFAIAGIYIKEVAISKKQQTDDNSRMYQFPLKTEIKPL